MRPAARLGWLAAASALAFVAVYGVALGTSVGRRADAAGIVRDFGPDRLPRVHEATTDLLRTIDVTSIALLGGGMVVFALLRRRIGAAVVAAISVALANVTTQILKPAIADFHLFGEEANRDPGGGFPSGHATVAMSLALALVIVAPATLRFPVVVAGAAYAAAVGVALLALGWHYASDVAGGYLVAVFWAALVAAVAAARAPRAVDGVRRPGRWATAVGVLTVAVLAAAFIAALGAALERYSAVLEYGRAHTTFFVLSASVGALSLALLAVFTAAASRGPMRTIGPP